MKAPGWVELGMRLIGVRWRLHRRGFDTVAGAALQATAEQTWEDGPQAVIRLRRLARWLPGSTCLHRSLALIEAARSRGLNPRLVLGAQRRDGNSYAHAWVQLGAQTLGETQRLGQPYQAFPAPSPDH